MRPAAIQRVRRTLAAAAVACLVAAGCAADTESSGPDDDLAPEGVELVGNPDNAVAVTNGAAGDAPTWLYGSFPLCLDSDSGAASVRLDGVTLLGATNLELVSAGVKDLAQGENGVGALPGPMPPSYQSVTGLRFDTACGEGKQPAEVVLELRRTGEGTGSMEGFAIGYHAADQERTVRYRAQITLCADSPTDRTAQCEEAT